MPYRGAALGPQVRHADVSREVSARRGPPEQAEAQDHQRDDQLHDRESLSALHLLTHHSLSTWPSGRILARAVSGPRRNVTTSGSVPVLHDSRAKPREE